MPKRRKFPPHRPLRGLAERAKARPPAPDAEAPETSGDATFARAANALGVAALAPGRARIKAPATRAAPVLKEESEFVVREEGSWLEGYRVKLGPRVLERVRGSPRATLDLHGLRLTSARDRLVAFLARAPYPTAALVLIIVGKGRHSPGGRPVLAAEIATWLSSGAGATRVLAFRTAPPELGGSGGVLVLLAGSPAKPDA